MAGLECNQAVNASDYAIAQFAYLRKLLLVHGRWENYRRGILPEAGAEVHGTRLTYPCRNIFFVLLLLLAVLLASGG